MTVTSFEESDGCDVEGRRVPHSNDGVMSEQQHEIVNDTKLDFATRQDLERCLRLTWNDGGRDLDLNQSENGRNETECMTVEFSLSRKIVSLHKSHGRRQRGQPASLQRALEICLQARPRRLSTTLTYISSKYEDRKHRIVTACLKKKTQTICITLAHARPPSSEKCPRDST